MLQKTLVVIKPDGVERNLIGEIISYYEKAGLVVKSLKMLTVARDLVEQHYIEDEDYMLSIANKASSSGEKIDDPLEYGRAIVRGLRDYLTTGPVVAIILEGEEGIALARKVTGFTDPTKADKGTVRGDLGEDSFSKANLEKRPTKNLIHASGNPEEAEREIKLWFSE